MAIDGKYAFIFVWNGCFNIDTIFSCMGLPERKDVLPFSWEFTHWWDNIFILKHTPVQRFGAGIVRVNEVNITLLKSNNIYDSRYDARTILGMGSASERRRYIVKPSKALHSKAFCHWFGACLEWALCCAVHFENYAQNPRFAMFVLLRYRPHVPVSFVDI